MTAQNSTPAAPVGGVDVLYDAIRELGWGDIKPPFTPPKAVPVEHRDAAYAQRATSWCTRALDGKASDLAAMAPETGRNNALNNAGIQLYRYVLAGYLDGHHVTEALRDAALTCGLSNGEIEATLGSAQRGAEKYGPQEPPIDPPAIPAEPPDVPDDVNPETGEVRLTLEEMAERTHQNKVAAELAMLRAREEAKRLYVAERAALEFREPPSRLTLREELEIPDEPVTYAIDRLLPQGGNVLLTAQYKAGKTTLVNNLARSFADGEAFLGEFTMPPRRGRLALFNYELSDSQYRRWLREMGIVNLDAISVLNLRGYRLPLTASRIEDWIVGWLKEHDITFWIADPFARAAVGVDENSNTEVGVWLDTFDVIKERAGVSEGVLPVHTGRTPQESGQERARGATRLDDWADVRWLLTRDDEGDRYFRATGRDVEVAEEKLTYGEESRRLSFGGGDRQWVQKRRLEDAVVLYVQANPGANSTAVEQGVEGKADRVRAALKAAVVSHRVRVELGDKNARRHYSNE